MKTLSVVLGVSVGIPPRSPVIWKRTSVTAEAMEKALLRRKMEENVQVVTVTPIFPRWLNVGRESWAGPERGKEKRRCIFNLVVMAQSWPATAWGDLRWNHGHLGGTWVGWKGEFVQSPWMVWVFPEGHELRARMGRRNQTTGPWGTRERWAVHVPTFRVWSAAAAWEFLSYHRPLLP